MEKFFYYIFFLFSSFYLFAELKNPPLPEKYKKWLEEEVVYIITQKEKEVFLQLKNDREREIFIEAFWKARDPDPNTIENEFKDEHYRRISYANQYFGRLSPTPGWKTDRGRVYIILGEPNQKEVYDNLPDIYPVEVWFYQGFGKYGLPDAFYVVFFRRDDSSDYELYSPVRDGPKSLLRFFQMYRGGDPLDFEYAYRLLYQAKPELAKKAISLIPGEERGTTGPSLASEVLLSNIARYPHKRVKDEYAEKILKYRDLVEVDYTANYVESSFICKVIQEENGISFIHYSIEPKRFSVEYSNGNYRTILEIDGRLSDLTGKTIYQFSRKFPVSLTESDVNELKYKPVSLQGLIPVAEGNYKLSIILKNVVSKEFTVIESNINSYPFPRTLAMTPLLIGYFYKEDGNEKRAFKVGKGRIYLSPFPNFTSSENLHVLFSVIGKEEELSKCRGVKFNFIDETGKIFKEKILHLQPLSRKNLTVHESFELKDFKSGNFKLKVEIEDESGKVLLSETQDFGVSAVPYIPRPLIYSEPFAPINDPVYPFILAVQYFNKGENEKANRLFREAYSRNPLNQKFAIGYARSLLLLKKYSEIKEILTPFISSGKKDPDTFEILGIAHQNLGELDEAIKVYEQFLSSFGLKLSVLNSIGECYLKIGDREKALTVFEKSLEINPDQENIKKIVSFLKGK